jgi:hypothetical protein
MALGVQPKHEEIYHVDNLVPVNVWRPSYGRWEHIGMGPGEPPAKTSLAQLGLVKQGFQEGHVPGERH